MQIIGYLIIFLYCLIIVLKNKEIPNSISQTVYSLPYNWIFTLIMFISAFLIAPNLFEILPEAYKFLAFLTIGGILGVGVDPLIKGDKNIVHYISAIIMGVSSQIIIYLLNPYLLLLWIPYIIYTMYKEDGTKNMFIAEMVMFISLFILQINTPVGN